MSDDGGRGQPGAVVVVGAGVVGMACALYLQRAGLPVTVIDRLPPGEACSYGNAGGIAVSHLAPVAMPGVLRRIPRWLLERDGPLALRWAHLPAMTPWLLPFAP